jgi:sugar/nucleoside kinase (ribokinase family)
LSVTVVSLGVHVLDVLVRPVEAIPDGQGGQLVEQIRATAAGTAGGTSLTLAKLGARSRSAGAIGSDPLGDLLVELLQRGGVETDLLLRRDDVQTSASVLPIRPNGERPAFHVVGANATYGADDAPREAIERADHLHLGAPEFMGGEAAATVLGHARASGTRTSADVLAGGDPGLFEWIAPALPHVDVFLPNDEQVLGFTGESELEAGCRALLDRGVGMVAATCGADGAMVAEGDRVLPVPAFDIDVVDTTGCGDAFSAGFVVGLGLGRDPRDAAVLGCAAAGLVAGGLGSDHGDFDLAAADAFAAATPLRGQGHRSTVGSPRGRPSSGDGQHGISGGSSTHIGRRRPSGHRQR